MSSPGRLPGLFDASKQTISHFCYTHRVIQNKVEEFRTGVGLTQEELAQKVGVTRQTISALEKGNYTPSVALALKLAKVFKTSVEDLFLLS